MGRTSFVGRELRPASTAVMHTFYAADFAGRSIVVVNASSAPSFARVGRLRYVLGAGEDQHIAIPRDADYHIELGIGVQLEEG
jgi:hypothetical protein